MRGLPQKLQEFFPEAVIDTHHEHGDETVIVRKEFLLKVAECVKSEQRFDFNMLMDVTAVDGLLLNWKPRFEVVYHFYSLNKNQRLRVKVPVDVKDLVVPSLTGFWPSANWFEREVWDMFGIQFEGHPNLKRILLYEEFQGHPLRKDYPVNRRHPLIGPKN